jgi:transposase
MTLPDRTVKEVEARRKEAVRARNRGISAQQIAEVLNVSKNTVYSWKEKYDSQGIDALQRNRRTQIEDVSLEQLHEALNEVDESRAMQRVMVTINYKCESVSRAELAERYDIASKTVWNWVQRAKDIEEESPAEAFSDAERPGAPRALPEEKLSELEDLLEQGPEAQGFIGQLWTGKRVAQVIEEEFDVSVTLNTAIQYMKELGWSRKKPHRVALEREPEDIEQFRNKEWPDIRKTAEQDGQTIIFVDETKFRLLPHFLYTWAPKGEEATVESKSTFDFIAVIAALTYVPETQEFDLHFDTQRYNFNSESILPFLRDVTRSSRRDPVFLLDNWKPHKTAISELQEAYADTPTSIEAEYFPEYASDLNPTDRVWDLAKNTELPNYAPKSLDDLEEKVVAAHENIRTDDSKLRYCVKDAELEIEA